MRAAFDGAGVALTTLAYDVGAVRCGAHFGGPLGAAAGSSELSVAPFDGG